MENKETGSLDALVASYSMTIQKLFSLHSAYALFTQTQFKTENNSYSHVCTVAMVPMYLQEEI